jgi:hypothetical protein
MSLPGQHPVDVSDQRIKLAARIADLQRQIDGLYRAGSPGTGGSGGGSLTGAAGGVLSGTYPNPGFAVDMATQAELDNAVAFLQAELDAAIAALDYIAPGDAAGGDLTGTYPNPKLAKMTEPEVQIDHDTKLDWMKNVTSNVYNDLIVNTPNLGSFWKVDETGSPGRTFVDVKGVINLPDIGNGSSIPYYSYGQTPLHSGSTYSIYNPNQALAGTSFGGVPSGYAFAGHAQFSVEFWVKPMSQWGRNQLFSHFREDSSWKGWQITMDGSMGSSGTFYFRRAGTVGSYSTCSSASHSVGNVYHVVATYDGSTQRIYVNGVLEGSASGVSMTAGDEWFGIGRMLVDAVNMTPHYMDSPAIYTRALTATEVADHYAAGQGSYTAVGAGLRMQEDNTVSFASSNPITDGTLTQMPTLTNFSPVPGTYASGSVQGGDSAPGGFSAYYFTNKLLNADDTVVVYGDAYTASNYSLECVMWDPTTGWFIGAGYVVSVFSGNTYTHIVAYDGSTGASYQSQDSSFPIGYPPGANNPCYVKLVKSGNLVTVSVHDGDPYSTAPWSSTSLTLTGTAATNLGSGKKLRPGFIVGFGGDARFVVPSTNKNRLMGKVNNYTEGVIEKAILREDGTTDLLPQPGAIVTSHIADDAITAAKIATDAVGTSEIAADAVTASEIATDAVGTSEIANSAVTAGKLATTGTPDGSKFLRDDMAWATPAGGGGSGVSKGSSFPGSPTDGDLFIRTDQVGDPLYKFSDGAWELLPRMGAQTVPYAKVRRSSNQTINNTTQTTLNWDVEDVDTNSMHDNATNNSRITINTPGVYFIQAQLEWSASGSGGLGAYIVANGSTFLANDERGTNPISGDMHTQFVTTTARLAAGDYIEIQVWQNSGGSRSIVNNGSRSPNFQAIWLNGAGQTVDERGVPSARARKTVSQSISNATYTAVTYAESEDYDTDGIHDLSTNPSRFTAKTPGIYSVIGNVSWASNSTGRRQLVIYKNGSGVGISEQRSATNGAWDGQFITGEVQLAAGDYVEIWAWQDSGGALNITDATASVSLVASGKTVTPFAAAHSNANQAITTSTNTAITFQVEDSDNDGIFSPTSTQFVCRTAGIYYAVGSVIWEANANGQRYLFIGKNGADTNETSWRPGAATSSPRQQVSGLIELAVGDVVELYAIQDTGSNLNVLSGTSLKLVKIGAPPMAYPPDGVAVPAVRAIDTSGTQTLATGVETGINFNTNLYDTDGIHSTTSNTSRFTAKTPGIYNFAANLRMNVSGGTTRYIYVKKNGSESVNLKQEATSSAATDMAVAGQVMLAAGDYLELWGFQNSGGTYTLPAASTGTPFIAEFAMTLVGSGKTAVPYALAYSATDNFGSIPNSTATAVPLSAELADNDNIHDNATNNSRLTCRTAGVYVINGAVVYAGNATGSYRQAMIRVNGSTVYADPFIRPLGTDQARVPVTATVELAAGDYVELLAYQDSGGALNLRGGVAGSTMLSMIKIGASAVGQTGVDPVEGVHLVGGSGEPAFASTFANYGFGEANVGFYKDRQRVYFQGMFNGGSGVGVTMFTLPAGYRPSQKHHIPTMYSTGGAPTMGRIIVNTDGTVMLQNGTNTINSSNWNSLSGLSFPL